MFIPVCPISKKQPNSRSPSFLSSGCQKLEHPLTPTVQFHVISIKIHRLLKMYEHSKINSIPKTIVFGEQNKINRLYHPHLLNRKAATGKCS